MLNIKKEYKKYLESNNQPIDQEEDNDSELSDYYIKKKEINYFSSDSESSFSEDSEHDNYSEHNNNDNDSDDGDNDKERQNKNNNNTIINQKNNNKNYYNSKKKKIKNNKKKDKNNEENDYEHNYIDNENISDNLKYNIFNINTNLYILQKGNLNFYNKSANNFDVIPVQKIKELEIENIRNEFNEELIKQKNKIRRRKIDEFLGKFRNLNLI